MHYLSDFKLLINMGGRGAGKKYTVKTFLDVSSKKSIDGIRNSIWLAPSSSSTNKVVCKICKTQGGEMKELQSRRRDANALTLML